MYLYRIFQHIYFRVADEIFYVPFKGVVTKFIIRIHEGYVGACGRSNASVTCSAETTVLLMDDTDAVVIILQLVA